MRGGSRSLHLAGDGVGGRPVAARVWGTPTPRPRESPCLLAPDDADVRLGLPFFALSTMAPLVQRWFSTLPVPSAANPYLLLCGQQHRQPARAPGVSLPAGAAVGHAHADVGVVRPATCSARAHRRVCADPPTRERASRNLRFAPRRPGIGVDTRSRWTAMAFVPSSLMLGVTTHISTDLASIPLLWVLPLAAYLLTFVLVFSTRDVIPRTLVARALPLLVLAALALDRLPAPRALADPAAPGGVFRCRRCVVTTRSRVAARRRRT